jgi:plasmid stability protein
MSSMPSLLIGNVDAALPADVKEHAAVHHHSSEEEAHELLRASVARQRTPPQEHPVDIACRLFDPENGVELDIPPRGAAAERLPPDFLGDADKL